MKFIRIKSYFDGKLIAEHLYLTDSQKKAIQIFCKDYPEHYNCIVIAENYDSNKHKEHFKACLNCGCVHYQ